MKNKNTIILFIISILFFSLSLLGVYVFALEGNPGHSADYIGSGSFGSKVPGDSGNYLFNNGGNVLIGSRPPRISTRTGRLVITDMNPASGEIGLGGGYYHDMWVDPGTDEDFWITYGGCAGCKPGMSEAEILAESKKEDLVVNWNPFGSTKPEGNYNRLKLNLISGDLWIGGVLKEEGSSIKKKKNLEIYKGNFLNRIKKINSYLFHFKTQDENEKKHFGYMLEDLPSEVLTEDGAIDSLAYNGMLLKLIQEQQKEIETLKREVQKLKRK